MAYQCDWPDDGTTQAEILQTDLRTGQVNAFCEPHYLMFMEAAVDVLHAEQADAARAEEEAAANLEAAPTPLARRRARRAARDEPPGEGVPEPVEEGAGAVGDG